jgi:hypothetical protein
MGFVTHLHQFMAEGRHSALANCNASHPGSSLDITDHFVARCEVFIQLNRSLTMGTSMRGGYCRKTWILRPTPGGQLSSSECRLNVLHCIEHEHGVWK